ncbi:MAG: ribonuclease D [Candidatus Obscuribacterales bacterium]|jgi:ribonuclease D|nr:ribonuclease D [Candidatus Obscuribacterales bacterium]
MTIISTDTELLKLCAEIDAGQRFAMDLEFIPERTYEPEICLVQVATDKGAYIVDPYEVSDLMPLWSRVADPNILAVFHAGDQDLDLMNAGSDLIPQNIVDTQIAAGFCGFGYPIGYGKILGQLLNISISKSESFTDWTNRPLTKSQITYALEDVAHLLDLHDKLMEQLDSMGRKQWALDECKRYTDPGYYAKDRSRDFMRIKGASSLNRRSLAVLRALSDWRHEEAEQCNRPLKSICADNVMFEFARHPPKSQTEVMRIRGFRPDQAKQYAGAILRAVEQAMALPEGELPVWPQSRIPSKREVLISDFLFTVLKVLTFDEDIAAELVTTRSALEALVRMHFEGSLVEEKFPLLVGWRRELVGEKLISILKGAECKMQLKSRSHPISLEVNGKRIEH